MRFTDNQSLDTANMANLDILAGTDVSSGTDKKFTLANLASWFLGQFNGLSLAGNNQTVQAAIDEMSETKADADGEYDNLVVGTSKQLLSDSYTEDFTPYKFRKSPYTDRLSESIVGTSVAWNQLAENASPPTSRNGMTIQATDGGFTINGTASASTSASGWFQLGGSNENYLRMSGHKVLVAFNLLSGTATAAEGATYLIRFKLSSGTDNVYLGTPRIVAPTLTSSSSASLGISGGAVFTNAKFSILVFDLTAMFGTTVADALYNMGDEGVKLFRSWYPSTYYAYSAPTLEHVSGLEAHEMVGFNQWDEEWELGSINTNSGAKQNSTITIRNRNDIRVLPNTEYYFRIDASSNTIAYYYREDLSFISASGERQNKVFTTPSDCAWLRFVSNETVNHDICVNLSDPTRNGQYKPYSKHSYVLDSSLTLRGLIKYDATKGFYADGDTYASDGAVTRRYGIVDLGTVNWTAYSGKEHVFATTGISSVKKVGNFNLICGKYTTATAESISDMADKTIKGHLTTGNVYIEDSAYTDAASFKTAMSGVMLVYELATPTTESAEPFDAIQITDGTEEYVTDCLVPVGHESKYYANLRSKIEGLPTDFSAIICATEATNKASKNYAVGDYLIYNNTLYKVTTAIATDATLTVGTNITATTIMAEIKALQ